MLTDHNNNKKGGGYRMTQDEHTALSRLWEYSKDPNAPRILFDEQNHLTICQDCVAILWMCRGSASVDDVRKRLREHGKTAN
jgi:hypothetical protein